MKKEDILKKAQEENTDEMEKFIQDKSMWWIFIVMVVCLIAFSIIRQENGQSTSDLTVTITSGVAAGNYYRFAKLRNKSNLLAAIFMTVGAIICLIFFILEH